MGNIFPRRETAQWLMQGTHVIFREKQFGEKGIGFNRLLQEIWAITAQCGQTLQKQKQIPIQTAALH